MHKCVAVDVEWKRQRREAVARVTKLWFRGILWGTSQVESKSTDASGYVFDEACLNSLAIFVNFGPNFGP